MKKVCRSFLLLLVLTGCASIDDDIEGVRDTKNEEQHADLRSTPCGIIFWNKESIPRARRCTSLLRPISVGRLFLTRL